MPNKEVVLGTLGGRGLSEFSHIEIKDGKIYGVLAGESSFHDRDVTAECSVDIQKSQHTDGFYCHIRHNGNSVVALGVDDSSKCIVKRGYRIEKANGATVSFKIFRSNR